MSNQQNATPDVAGDLKVYPFPRLLFYLFNIRFTGRLDLELDEQDWTGKIYFRSGEAVLTDIRSNRDVLGRVLLERGTITQKAFDRSLEALASSSEDGERMRQGQILISQGALSEEELITGLQMQLQRKLMRIFPRTDFRFKLFTMDHPYGREGHDAEVKADPFWVIYHGVHQHYESSQMVNDLVKMRGKALRLHPGFEKFRARFALDDNAGTLLTTLSRGSVLYEDILRMSDLGQVETEMLLYCLWVTEMMVTTRQRTTTDDTLGKDTETAASRHSTTGQRARAISSPSHGAVSDAGTSAEPDLRRSMETGVGDLTATLQAAAKHRKLVQDTYERLEGQDHFDVLGISKEATNVEIKDAYFNLAKTFHPDRCSALGLDNYIDHSEEIFRRISEAQNILLDEEARKKYEDQFTGKTTEQDVRGALEAEFVFQKGLFHFRKKEYGDAMNHFEEAFALNPREGEHLAYIAWTLYHDPRQNQFESIPQAEEKLLQAVKISPRSATTLYFLGELYANRGKYNEAIRYFNRCLEIKPDHFEAERHLRIIMKKRDERKAHELRKQGGFFNRIMGGESADKKGSAKKSKKGKKGGKSGKRRW